LAAPTSWTVSPRLAREAEPWPACVVTDTLATTWATAIPCEPLTPFQDALTAAVPLPTAVTSPPLETCATAGALLAQAKATLPLTSPKRGFVAVADSCTVWFRLENEVGPEAATEMVST